MSELKVVILDIDGTLLLSNAAHATAFTEAAEKLGLEADYLKILGLIGKGSDKLIPEAFGIAEGSILGKKLERLKAKIFRDWFLPNLDPNIESSRCDREASRSAVLGLTALLPQYPPA